MKHVNKEIPELKENDVLIRVSTATICGTDIKIINGDYDTKPPVVLGHEFAGYVEEYGSGVSTVKKGDLVTIEPHLFCGLCRYCLNGREHLCFDKKGFGVALDGGFAQFCVVPESTVYKLPKGISDSVAVLTENIGCCIHGIERANIEIGNYVTIIDGGFAGVVLAELVKLKGAKKVCVREPNEYRRNIIKKRGFDVINPNSKQTKEKIRDITNGFYSDVVIEAVGKAETAKLSLELVSRGGNVLFFGVSPSNERILISPNDIYKRELNIMGSVINPYTHFRAIDMLDKLNLEPLITHHFNLEEINRAFNAAEEYGGFKIAVHP